MMKKQAFNPFLPLYAYMPDGEAHVFDGRVYFYGSHDKAGGTRFCMKDYLCWSAPLEDLGDWRCEGEIYRRTQDPSNPKGKYELWAPDAAQGPDGRFYLYYCLADRPEIGVAVCDTPGGKFEFWGHVRDKAGNSIGKRAGDTLPFDPAVLVEAGRVWLYSGNGPLTAAQDRAHKKGSVVMELAADMCTVKAGPLPLLPTVAKAAGTGFEGHEFFEASSIRKFAGRYYFSYSSVRAHELCWAVSDRPDGAFSYGGVLVSNGDIRPEEKIEGGFNAKANRAIRSYIGNNHGCLALLNGAYYVFYHRQTHRRMSCRQACAERLEMTPDGRFLQAGLSSCGLNGGPLRGTGRYPAAIACHLFSREGALFSAHPMIQNRRHPAIIQEGGDRDAEPGPFIENLRDGATAGFRSFLFKNPKRIAVRVRGRCSGSFVVRDELDGKAIAEIALAPTKDWKIFESEIRVSTGVHPLYFVYTGRGWVDFESFTIR